MNRQALIIIIALIAVFTPTSFRTRIPRCSRWPRTRPDWTPDGANQRPAPLTRLQTA